MKRITPTNPPTPTTRKRIRITIHQDSDPESPRDWDNLGTMVCWHRRSNYGDIQPSESPTEYMDALPKDELILPIYAYEHSGIALSTSGDDYPFTDPWDAGQLGIIHVSAAKIREKYGNNGKAAREKAAACLRSEVSVYNQYLNGDVWGFEVEECTHCDTCEHDKWEHIDSCWGFYGLGKDNGMSEHIEKQYHAALFEALDNPETPAYVEDGETDADQT